MNALQMLSFAIKRTIKGEVHKKKEAKREFILEFGQDVDDDKDANQSAVIPKQENSFQPGKKNTFVPRFVPKTLTTKSQVQGDDRFEAAENPAPKEVQYGLQERKLEFEPDSADQESLDKFRAEVSSLPDEADSTAYQRMPVSSFGLAMLKGMDWKEGQALGKNKERKPVEAIEYVPRASRLGLGAKPDSSNKRGPTMVLPIGPDGRIRHVRGLDEKLVPIEESGIRSGDRLRIVSGEHEGLKCTALAVTDSQGFVQVRLDNEEQILVAETDLRRSGSESSVPKTKKRKTEAAEKTDAWLFAGIRVRIVDKRMDNGKYYLKKGRVVDIVSPGVANLMLDDSELLKENIKQSSLETVVPRRGGGLVMVVKGQHKGLKAKLLEKRSGVVVVQLESDLSVIRLSFDDIAEFVCA